MFHTEDGILVPAYKQQPEKQKKTQIKEAPTVEINSYIRPPYFPKKEKKINK